MIDHAISPTGLALMFVFAIVATGVTIGLLFDRLGRLTFKWLPEAIKYVVHHVKTPDDGDRLVGITVLICGIAIVTSSVIFLISDLANDWPGLS